MNLLIADDNQETQEQLQTFLEEQGHKVFITADGDSALQMFSISIGHRNND